jgi:hypothetical protein
VFEERKIFQELDQAGGIIASVPGLKEQLGSLSIPAVSDSGTDRHLFPIEGMDQDGGLAFRRPSAPDRRSLPEATLIFEEDPGFAPPSVFLPQAIVG